MENPDAETSNELGDSFRQSRKELWVMVGAWTFFFIWTFTYCSIYSDDTEITLGIPRWVLFGIALPWVLANVFIIWFSMFFMKDTDLGEEDNSDQAKATSDQ